MKSLRRAMRVAVVAAVAAVAAAPGLYAQQEEESEAERNARLARRGAGLRVGAWDIEESGHAAPAAENSPLFEGYFQRGLDKRLALESSIAVIRRVSTPDPIFDGTAETKSYLVPLLTSLKFYPFTTVAHQVEPYIMAGIGFALGVEDQPDNSFGGGGTSIVTGFGFRTGAGLEFHLSSAFGLVLGGRYQWVKYGENLGGDDTFRGVGFEGGITYSFQF